MDVSLETNLKDLTRVGAVTSSRLKNLGLTTVEDLLFYFPSRYEDYSVVIQLSEVKAETVGTVHGEVQDITHKITRYRRPNIVEAVVSDGTDEIKIVWFNQPYIINALQAGDRVTLSGKIEQSGFGLEMRSPEWEKGEGGVHTGRLVPVYPLTAGITQKQIRFLVSQSLGALKEIEEWVDEGVNTGKMELQKLPDAVQNIHFPENKDSAGQARLRMKFDELFLLQLKKARTRADHKKVPAPEIKFKKQLIKKFVQSLPFDLTDAQRKVTWQILQDLERAIPMNRLLQGDVGSGKTLVALIAMLNTAKNGYQAVMMAPTEILAKQHYETVCGFLKEFEVIVGLVTRSKLDIRITNYELRIKEEEKKNKKKSRDSLFVIRNSDIVIGTHALIQEKIQFKKLGLVIIDEQHRFGVDQRKQLKEKSGKKAPHFFSMTATPIPRSLSLTVYGDLDLSILDEMPKGRKPIETRVVSPRDRKKSYEFIQKQIDKGRQVFVICPLIDESDKLGVKAASVEYEKLDKKVFPHLKVALLHGKLKDDEKDAVQKDFRDGKSNILVATSVVEVGVDVPNASVMMIEGAERFGLAQLHQFRGRVGRSKHQSYCFLFTDSRSENVFERLDFLSTTNDGFEIAEFDMKHRGAGNMYGKEQSGIPEFKVASFNDYQLIEFTQKLARDILEKDPDLVSFPGIKKKLEHEGGEVHLE